MIQRGNNREACFFAEQDYTVYLSKLEKYAKKLSVAVYSYVLMTNHVNLLLTPKTEDGVSRLQQSLGRYKQTDRQHLRCKGVVIESRSTILKG